MIAVHHISRSIPFSHSIAWTLDQIAVTLARQNECLPSSLKTRRLDTISLTPRSFIFLVAWVVRLSLFACLCLGVPIEITQVSLPGGRSSPFITNNHQFCRCWCGSCPPINSMALFFWNIHMLLIIIVTGLGKSIASVRP